MSIAPELGIAQPGMLITCNDSHTATNGACGALAIPIGGGNQLRHVVATQTVWLKKPKTLRISIDGTLPAAVTAKDVILSIIREIGVGGATGYAVEYAGSAIRVHVDGRPADDLQHVDRGRRAHRHDRPGRHDLSVSPRPPQRAARARTGTSALAYWATLPTDAGRERSIANCRSMPAVSHRW